MTACSHLQESGADLHFLLDLLQDDVVAGEEGSAEHSAVDGQALGDEVRGLRQLVRY
jgi:hypothetical protein